MHNSQPITNKMPHNAPRWLRGASYEAFFDRPTPKIQVHMPNSHVQQNVTFFGRDQADTVQCMFDALVDSYEKEKGASDGKSKRL